MEKIILRNDLWLQKLSEDGYVYYLYGDIENIVFNYDNEDEKIVSLVFKDSFTIEIGTFLISNKRLKLEEIIHEDSKTISLKFSDANS